MHYRCLPLAFILSITSLTRATAQWTPPDSATLARTTQVLANELRQYVSAQERYYVTHRSYATSAQATALQSGPGVTVILLTSLRTGHTAIAIHEDAPGLVCAIWVGLGGVRAPLNDGAREGEPTCHVP
jgi:hypothetical protein